MIKIAIDAMGSDAGSAMVVEAVKKFKEDYKDADLYVVGKEEELKELSSVATIINADEVMGMEDGALEVLRRKNTSMMKAIDLVANHTCDGVVSAGGTGAFLTGATIKLKMIPGAFRAAMMSPFPTEDNKGVIMLDIGANNENTPEQLVQFAKMGAVFVRAIYKREPKVYLLSNGAEEKKGSPVVKEAHKLLKEEKDINFCGNIEGRYVLTGQADVVVAEGYAGNVMLKTIEGVASMFKKMIKDAFTKNALTKVGYLFAKSGFDDLSTLMDYRKYGGGMLLGINGVVIKGHGNSNAWAFYNAIRLAYELIQADVIKKLGEAVNNG